MVNTDIKEKIQYKNLIIEQIKSEINLSEEQLGKLIVRLSKASNDELERTYEAFKRFGVQTIFNNL